MAKEFSLTDILRNARTLNEIDAAGIKLLEEAKRRGLLAETLTPEQRNELAKLTRASRILGVRRRAIAKEPLPSSLIEIKKNRGRERQRKKYRKRRR